MDSTSDTSFDQLLVNLGEASQEKTIHHMDGETLIESGQSKTDLFVIQSGRVKITTPQGSELILTGPTIVGEQSLLTGRETNAKVQCIGNVSSTQLTPEKFWAYIQNETKGPEILKTLNRLQSDRLRNRFHSKPYIALVAHDGRKDDLVEVANKFSDYLSRQPLLSTKHTGDRMQNDVGLNISRVVHSGPTGGDQEVGTLVVEGLVQAVLFFPDPLTAQPHFMDVGALQRVCDVCHIPMASNKGSGIHLLKSLSLSENTSS